jgi:hypothetical protein
MGLFLRHMPIADWTMYRGGAGLDALQEFLVLLQVDETLRAQLTSALLSDSEAKQQLARRGAATRQSWDQLA